MSKVYLNVQYPPEYHGSAPHSVTMLPEKLLGSGNNTISVGFNDLSVLLCSHLGSILPCQLTVPKPRSQRHQEPFLNPRRRSYPSCVLLPHRGAVLTWVKLDMKIRYRDYQERFDVVRQEWVGGCDGPGVAFRSMQSLPWSQLRVDSGTRKHTARTRPQSRSYATSLKMRCKGRT